MALGVPLAAVLAAMCAPASAQDTYPSRPVKIIAPQAPGGGVDLVARIIADKLRVAMGQPFVVENQAGAGGAIATQMTARAQPDGYTLMIGYVATHATNPAVKHNLGYDAVKDFTPIAMLGGTPNVLVVARAVPVNTLQEFVAYAKANPGKVDYGTSGVGTLNHLRDGAVQARVRRAQHGRALSQHRPGVHRCHGRTDPGDFSGTRRRAAARALGRVQAARRDRRQAPAAAARCADVQGVRLRRVQRPHLVRHRRAGEVARGHHAGSSTRKSTRCSPRPTCANTFTAEALNVMPMTPPQFGKYIADEIAHWTAVARASKIEAE